MENSNMTSLNEQKPCPYCAEMVAAQAKKCKHCSEIIDPALREIENMKRHGRNSPIIVNNNNNNNNNNGNNSPGGYLHKSRIIYIVLALLLGVCGIHNFYAGYAGRGIIQLLLSCTGFGLVIVIPWVLLEILLVRSDSRGMLFQ